MNVLYLTYDGLTDSLGQAQILPYLVGLSANDIKFTIISFDKPDAYLKQERTVSAIVENNQIDWISLRYTKNPPFFSTLYDISKFKKAVKKEILSNKISIIHCRSYISAIVGLWAKKKFGIPFIFDMRGFWADERIDGKIWNLSKPHHKKAYDYFKLKEKEFLQEAAQTISLTHCGKTEIESWNLPNLSPIHVIPCCTDEKLFTKIDIDDKRKELGIDPNDFVLSYIGSIGTWYMLDEMLDFFMVLVKHYSNAKFLFLTKEDENLIKQAAAKKNINTDAVIVNAVNRNDMPSYISASNASIFFIKPAYSKKASSPTKMGEIMNLGIPVVCNSNVGDVTKIMNECLPNLLVNEFTEKEYSRIINELANNFDTEKIILTAKNYYSLTNGVENYFSVYQQIKSSA